MIYYNQTERLNIVFDIIKNLKNYKMSNDNIINLYNSDLCSFIDEFKKITNKYIKQDDNGTIIEYKGKLFFKEINKNIEYILPANKKIKPLFVIRM